MKRFYRISPGISGLKKTWIVEFVTQQEGSVAMTSTKGHFNSLRSAKSMVAHFRRKPITIAAR